jgi:diaminopimelate epimerase
VNLPFEKWHGLGNDFVLVHESAWSLAGGGADLAARMCARHFGIGADGVLLVGDDPEADLSMVVLNSDGSRPEMCGNGLRCVAAAHGAGEVRVATDTGTYQCTVEEQQVTVPMGEVTFPSHGPISVTTDATSVSLHLASTGNPHAILLLEGGDPMEVATRLGPSLTQHARFPHGSNIEVAVIRGKTAVQLVVWERGAGLTLACGTGACATVATLVRLGLVDADTDIDVHLPGGTLTVWASRHGETWMRGPATFAFRGEFAL